MDAASGRGLGQVSPDLSWRLRARLYAVAAFGSSESARNDSATFM
jgi:hypothetical protein